MVGEGEGAEEAKIVGLPAQTADLSNRVTDRRMVVGGATTGAWDPVLHVSKNECYTATVSCTAITMQKTTGGNPVIECDTIRGGVLCTK